jgi:hypothetical protein
VHIRRHTRDTARCSSQTRRARATVAAVRTPHRAATPCRAVAGVLSGTLQVPGVGSAAEVELPPHRVEDQVDPLRQAPFVGNIDRFSDRLETFTALPMPLHTRNGERKLPKTHCANLPDTSRVAATGDLEAFQDQLLHCKTKFVCHDFLKYLCSGGWTSTNRKSVPTLPFG